VRRHGAVAPSKLGSRGCNYHVWMESFGQCRCHIPSLPLYTWSAQMECVVTPGHVNKTCLDFYTNSHTVIVPPELAPGGIVTKRGRSRLAAYAALDHGARRGLSAPNHIDIFTWKEFHIIQDRFLLNQTQQGKLQNVKKSSRQALIQVNTHSCF
jgi:hypothetical protein